MSAVSVGFPHDKDGAEVRYEGGSWGVVLAVVSEVPGKKPPRNLLKKPRLSDLLGLTGLSVPAGVVSAMPWSVEAGTDSFREEWLL